MSRPGFALKAQTRAGVTGGIWFDQGKTHSPRNYRAPRPRRPPDYGQWQEFLGTADPCENSQRPVQIQGSTTSRSSQILWPSSAAIPQWLRDFDPATPAPWIGFRDATRVLCQKYSHRVPSRPVLLPAGVGRDSPDQPGSS